jgi:hypothetical protein
VAAKGKGLRPALLKWGAAGLLVLGMGIGLWMWLDAGPSPLGSATSQSGSTPDKPLDPDDPRNRKADRLPSPNGP